MINGHLVAGMVSLTDLLASLIMATDIAIFLANRINKKIIISKTNVPTIPIIDR